MGLYRPQTPLQHLLCAFETAPGYLGRTCTRKMKRRYVKRALADFARALETLRPGDLVFDFGANLGEFTLKMAATGAEVHAFEPDPLICDMLRLNTAEIENVVVHQKAVGQQAGRAVLRRMPNMQENLPNWSQHTTIVYDDDRFTGGEEIEVEVAGFWDILAAHRPARLIKMDIEGAEMDILDHAVSGADLPAFGKLFVETHEHLDPTALPRIRELRKLASQVPNRYINLYWV